jgi:hypothetical protein
MSGSSKARLLTLKGQLGDALNDATGGAFQTLNDQHAELANAEGRDPRLSLELAYRVCQRGVGVKQRLEGELHDMTIILIAK